MISKQCICSNKNCKCEQCFFTLREDINVKYPDFCEGDYLCMPDGGCDCLFGYLCLYCDEPTTNDYGLCENCIRAQFM